MSSHIDYWLRIGICRSSAALNGNWRVPHAYRKISRNHWRLWVSFYRLRSSSCCFILRRRWECRICCLLHSTRIALIWECESLCPWPGSGFRLVLSTLRRDLLFKVNLAFVRWFCCWFLQIDFLLLGCGTGLSGPRLLLRCSNTWFPWFGWRLNGIELELNLICKLSLFQGECIINNVIVTDVQAGHCVCLILTSLIERIHLGSFSILRFSGVDRTICYLAYLRVVSSFRLLSEWSFEGIVAALLADTWRPRSIT